MKPRFLFSTALFLALSTGAFAQSGSPAAGQTVGPAAGHPDTPSEPSAAKVQQPGKEAQQAQSAAPGGTGTSVGPATGTPDTPTEPPAARFQQPGKETAQTKSVTGPSAQGSADAAQGTAADNANRAGHVTTTHELKQALQEKGFSDVRIIAESFVVQAMKDGKRVTMMLGPNGLSAFQIVDENALNDETTGTVTPDGGAGSQPQ